jgi:hypothetical protein
MSVLSCSRILLSARLRGAGRYGSGVGVGVGG